MSNKLFFKPSNAYFLVDIHTFFQASMGDSLCEIFKNVYHYMILYITVYISYHCNIFPHSLPNCSLSVPVLNGFFQLILRGIFRLQLLRALGQKNTGVPLESDSANESKSEVNKSSIVGGFNPEFSQSGSFTIQFD